MFTVIKGARVIDGTGRNPINDAVIVIDDKRINAVGPMAEVRLPDEVGRVIDVHGKSVLPGFIDCHLNMVGPSHDEELEGPTIKNISASVLRGVANCRLCLEAGVTMARVDTCGHHGIIALRDAIASGVVPGPRLVVPGRAICMTGGHGWNYGNHEADGADEVRKAARDELKAGADWIKIMATAGAGSPTERIDDDQMTLDEIRAAVEEAHKKGKFAFAHVSCPEGARHCIEAGIDSIEHGLILEEDIVRDMVARGIYLVPTLGAYRRLVERGRQGLVPDYMYRKALEIVECHAKSFRMALAAGVKMATGTDSGQYWFPPGVSLLTEMEAMHGEGMSAMEVLRSATSRAAELLHVRDDIGSVECGKLADLVILDGDPLADMHNVHNTWAVFKEGTLVFKRESAEVL